MSFINSLNWQSNGYLVQPGNVEDMAERLLRVLKCPTRASEMGQAGRTLAERHSVNKSFGVHERLYRSIVKQTIGRKN